MSSDPVPSSAISDATTGGLSVIVITGGSTGDVLTLQSDGTYLPETPAGGGIGGTVGTTTNRLVKSSGTSGSTVQSTGITVDASNNVSGVGSLGCGAITSSGAVGLRSSLGYLNIIQGSFDRGLQLTDSGFYPVQSAGWNDFDNSMTLGAPSSRWSHIYGMAITASALMCCGVYTFATVPSASSNTGKFLRISDRAQKHAYSDGTNWRYFGDDAVIS